MKVRLAKQKVGQGYTHVHFEFAALSTWFYQHVNQLKLFQEINKSLK